MKSNNVNYIIAATEEIKNSNDTSMIGALLYKCEDPRITHQIRYKRKSVYQIKLLALAQITGIEPPDEITSEVDTSVISYFKMRLNTSK